jgi:hypothetical protein
MRLTEVFIVRIYRRGRAGGTVLMGTVEHMSNRWPRKFESFKELRLLLETPARNYRAGRHRRRETAQP